MAGGIAKEVAEYLEDQSVGTVGTNIWVGQMPDTPVASVALYAFGGSPTDVVSADLEYPGLQIRIRAADYAAAHTKALSVYTTLHGLTDTTIEGTKYFYIQADHAPEQGGRDENDNVIFILTFSILKEVE